MSEPPDQRMRPQIGDLIEIETPRGYAYAQYVYKQREQPPMGSLIRVLPGFYRERPDDWNDTMLVADRRGDECRSVGLVAQSLRPRGRPREQLPRERALLRDGSIGARDPAGKLNEAGCQRPTSSSTT